MNSTQLWYVLLPERRQYAGPFDSNRILKLLRSGKVKVDSYIWSFAEPDEAWTPIVECRSFRAILTNPRFLFTLTEEEYLKIYRALTKTTNEPEGRLSWFESYLQQDMTVPEMRDVATIVHSAPLPRRSRRVSLDQTILARSGNNFQRANGFVISLNGVYFNVPNVDQFTLGCELGLETIDSETQTKVSIQGLVTCEDEAESGKNIGIRFLDMNTEQRTFIEKLVKDKAA